MEAANKTRPIVQITDNGGKTNQQAGGEKAPYPMQGESQREGKWFGSSKGCTATPHPAQALGQPGGFGGQGRITEVLQPCPTHKRASRQLQTELPTELVSFLQCPGPAGSGLQLCWLHFIYLKLKTRTGAWWPQALCHS